VIHGKLDILLYDTSNLELLGFDSGMVRYIRPNGPLPIELIVSSSLFEEGDGLADPPPEWSVNKVFNGVVYLGAQTTAGYVRLAIKVSQILGYKVRD
jgi:hypothetical protein